MFQKDFILRMIQEMVELLGIVLGLIKRKRYGEAMELTDEALKERFGLDVDWLLEASDEEIQSAMFVDGVLDEEKWKYTAELLHLKGMIYELIEDQEAYYKVKHRQLLLLLTLYKYQRGTFSFELIHNIEATTSLFERSSLSAAILVYLLHYYEDQLHFDKAENVLFELWEREVDKAGLRKLGVAFYERLLKKKEPELERGKLPLAEVKQGFADFEKLFLH